MTWGQIYNLLLVNLHPGDESNAYFFHLSVRNVELDAYIEEPNKLDEVSVVFYMKKPTTQQDGTKI
jgi:hypothetical protein